MNVVSALNEKLLKQPFTERKDERIILENYKHIASIYSKLENSIAVLSDLKTDKSYVYNGGIAEELGIAQRSSVKEINSIWEEDIFGRIHPDDLIDKHLLELQFFHLLKTMPAGNRYDYHISSGMRMRNNSGLYILVHHRMFYVCSCPSGNFWLSLCLYNHSYEKGNTQVLDKRIVNSATGEIIEPDKKTCNDILSVREKEILGLIEKGKMSKEIAELLCISKNTVDRHRQNILEKLRVKNSIEACRIAKLMNLL